MNEDPVEKAAAAIADGRTTGELGVGGAGAEGRGVLALARLAEAFRAALRGAPDPPRECLFRWAHLEVLEEIGAGGFGTVYRAWDTVLDREVALKLGRVERPGQDRLIVAEARRMARVRHPNVLAVHGADAAEGRTGIWSDLLNGETLRERLEREGAMAPGEALALALPLAEALAAVHERAIVHGDLKPGNVMVQPDGIPILMDFGAGGGLGGQRPLAGSPAVMAPELFAGQPLSAASDVYAFGVLLHCLLTARYPLEADTLDGYLQAHERGERSDLHGLPTSFRRLVGDCLVGDPCRRPTADTLARRLRDLAGAPARRRRRLAAGVVLTSLVVALGVSLLAQWRMARSEARTRMEQSRAEGTLRFLEEVLSDPNESQVRVVDLLDQASVALERSNDLAGAEAARLNRVLGQTYSSLEQADRAREHLEAALAWHLEHGDPDRGDDLAIRLRLAHNEQIADRHADAVRAYRAIAAEARARGGCCALLALEARAREGIVLVQDQHSVEGRAVLESVLPALEAREDARRLVTTVRETLAIAYREAGRLAEAETMARAARAFWLANRGSDTINAVRSASILGPILILTGQFDEAVELAEDSLATLDRILPGPSRRRLAMLNILATALAESNRTERAVSLSREVLEAVRVLRGERSLAAAQARGNLANRLAEAGEFEAALAETEAALALVLELRGPDSAPALMLACNRAENLLLAGRIPDAEEAAREAHEGTRRVLGEAHLYTLFAADLLGAARVRGGDALAGTELLRETRARKVETLGADNPAVDDTTAYLVEGLVTLGVWPEAQSEAVELLRRRRASLPPGHPEIDRAEGLLERVRSAQESGSSSGVDERP